MYEYHGFEGPIHAHCCEQPRLCHFPFVPVITAPFAALMLPAYSSCRALQLLLLLMLLILLHHTGLGEASSGSAVSPSSVLTGLELPKFSHEQLTVNISVQRGSTIHLHCKVTGLRDQSVAWYRRKGSEIHLITWGFQTYHNDDRFSLTYDHPLDWRLRIKYVQDRDEGTYECQVSTHPPLTRTIHLHVVVPAIQILDDRGVVLSEKFYKSGSTIELQCVVANVPTASSLQLAWYHGKDRLNYDASRGGVSVKTELRGSLAKSWLRVGDAKIEDSGLYYCNVTELSATSVTIHVVPEKYPAAIQGAWMPTIDTHLMLVTTSVTLSRLLLDAWCNTYGHR